MPEQCFGHRAATSVAGTDEQKNLARQSVDIQRRDDSRIEQPPAIPLKPDGRGRFSITTRAVVNDERHGVSELCDDIGRRTRQRSRRPDVSDGNERGRGEPLDMLQRLVNRDPHRHRRTQSRNNAVNRSSQFTTEQPSRGSRESIEQSAQGLRRKLHRERSRPSTSSQPVRRDGHVRQVIVSLFRRLQNECRSSFSPFFSPQ